MIVKLSTTIIVTTKYKIIPLTTAHSPLLSPRTFIHEIQNAERMSYFPPLHSMTNPKHGKLELQCNTGRRRSFIHYQGPDFEDMSSFFPCEIDDAIHYISLGNGVQAPKIVIL